MRQARLLRLSLLLFLIIPSLAVAQDDDLTTRFRQAELARYYRAMSKGWEEAGKLPEHERLYDVYHYDITVQLDPSDSTLVGTVYVRARSLVDTLSRIDLDLIANDTFTVNAVSGNGGSFTHTGHLLTIDLDAEYQQNDSFVVCVSYEGGPRPYSTNGLAWRRHGAHPVVQTLVEPAFSHYWWPCKDVPWDKADSSDVTLIVPDTLVGVSNGVLLDVDSVSTPGWKSWHWRTRHPIPPYLIFLAVSNYVTIEETYVAGDDESIPIAHYVWPEDSLAAKITFDYTPEMMEHLESLYGTYPFRDEGYGHAEVWGVGAMEHNTRTSFGDRLIVTNHGTDNVVVHEMGHQWWGDLVTCENWNDLWLNEGFATYTEALWREHLNGSQILASHMRGEEYHGKQPVYVDPVPDLNQIFTGDYVKAVYGKASWVLHMLRSITGTDTFFQILEQHRNDSVARGGFANTAQFQETCETVTGLDLNRFFRQWVYLSGTPQFETLPFVSLSGDSLWLRLTQAMNQDTCFAADVEITFGLASGRDTTLIGPVGAWCDTLRLVPGGEILNVRFDENNWLLDEGFITPLDTALAISEENNEVLLSWSVDHPFINGVFLYGGATEEGPWEQLTSSSLPLPIEGEFNDGKSAGIRYYAIRAVSDSLPGFLSLPSNVVQTTKPPSTELVFGSTTNPGSPNPHFLGDDPYKLRFNLAQSGRVLIRLYDITGRLVRTLYDADMASGFENEIEWDGNNNDGRQVAPGIYLIRFESGSFTDTRKIVVLK